MEKDLPKITTFWRLNSWSIKENKKSTNKSKSIKEIKLILINNNTNKVLDMSNGDVILGFEFLVCSNKTVLKSFCKKI